MATYHRIAIFIMVTIGVSITGVIYYRIGQGELFAMATEQFSGPFSSVISQLATLVPIILAIIEVGVAVWVISGGVQQERARVRRGR